MKFVGCTATGAELDDFRLEVCMGMGINGIPWDPWDSQFPMGMGMSGILMGMGMGKDSMGMGKLDFSTFPFQMFLFKSIVIKNKWR